MLRASAALLAVGSIDGILAARAQDTAEQEAQIAAAAISVLPTDPEPSGLLASVQVERTGTLFVGDLEVEVDNGTPGLEGLIAWSFAQFHAHGLARRTYIAYRSVPGRSTSARASTA